MTRAPGRGGSGARRRPCRSRGSRSDVALAHLDRPFDYRVPAHLDDVAVPGVRVRVRFAGRLVDGFLLDRVGDTDHVRATGLGGQGGVARAGADGRGRGPVPRGGRPMCRGDGGRPAARGAAPARPGGGRGRGARRRPGRAREPPGIPRRAGRRIRAGPALLDALAGGRAAHAVWQALPGECVGGPARRGRGRHRGGRPRRSARRARPARRRRSTGRAPRGWAAAVVALTAELGPAERYRRWLRCAAARSGSSSAPASAMFAPVAGLGLVGSGTTATTCTRSPARRTRTSATCCCCARTRWAPRCWSAASPARPRRRCWSVAGGPGRSWPTGRRVRAAAPRASRR